jgi:hypothetical protein
LKTSISDGLITSPEWLVISYHTMSEQGSWLHVMSVLISTG